MNRDKRLFLYLNGRQRTAVRAGQGGMMGRVAQAVERAGWPVILLPEEAREAAAAVDGYHLVLNAEVKGDFCLSLRRCYMDPFWRIEDTNDRWGWEVGRKAFDDASVPAGWARAFRDRWRVQLFKDQPIRRDGHIFVPLQGKLLRRRSFQSMSPIEMLQATLAADPTRRVIATLHPAEEYTVEERTALNALAGPRFELSDQPSIRLLATCDLVVTQNSSMALTGFFAGKAAVLFAQTDFHHLAGSVPRDGLAAAFDHAERPVDYAAYLLWFFKRNAITSWADDVEVQILARLRHHGWRL